MHSRAAASRPAEPPVLRPAGRAGVTDVPGAALDMSVAKEGACSRPLIACDLPMYIAELRADHAVQKTCIMLDSVGAGAKFLFAYETDEEQERADALITWLETGQLPHPLIGEGHFEFKTAVQLQRKHLPRFFSSCRGATTSLRLNAMGRGAAC